MCGNCITRWSARSFWREMRRSSQWNIFSRSARPRAKTILSQRGDSWQKACCNVRDDKFTQTPAKNDRRFHGRKKPDARIFDIYAGGGIAGKVVYPVAIGSRAAAPGAAAS